jgi:hypothetical protein
MKKGMFLVVLCCAISCTSLDFFGYKDLGNHYFLWKGDHYLYSIIYSQNDQARVGGTLIIGPNKNVVKYNSNNEYIIAKTIAYKSELDSVSEFWIIDKKPILNFDKNDKANVLTGPLDSATFARKLKTGNILLNWIDVPKH